ncbi:MAG TPA: NB-ARC domain-containing protein, partial [Thermomicrobiaceae bacterium]|nr:NB-ARC domain-containing protein [Thermomicrobiaceae bacterium]
MPIERAHNLPAPRDRLIGRAREIEAVRELLLGGTHRLVTLTGMGGAGKTRLALEVVWTLRERFPGGVWLVELAGVADDASLPETVASALGLLQVPDSSPTEALIAFLRTRSPLLVLDNCEHLIAAVANLAEQLLDRCPGLRMLTTSREPLQIAGERQLRVGPLALPGAERFASVEEVAHAPAVELFVARARDVAPGFALSPENAPVVAAICIRVDGVPLALELAAARVRVLTVEQILARLDDSMRLLTGGSRSGLTRQQTLKATLDWSYDLLGEPERAGLRRLSVFARGGGLDAAEAVCGGGEIAPEDLLEVLTRLVDKSLLVVDGTGVAARYRLLEPVRQYAAQQLDEAGERARVKSAHARFYHALATRAALFLHGPDQIAWLDQLEAEHDNLRAALQWSLAEGDPVLGLHLAVALSPFWEARGRLSEGRRWLEALLAAPDAEGLPAELRTRALLAVGRLAQWLADPDAAAPLEAALALARQRGDQAVVVEALAYLGAVRRHAGAQEDSARLLEESLTLARAAGDEAGIALALLTFGVTMRFQGNYAPSVPLLVEGLERFQ